MIELVQCEMLLAASLLDVNNDSQGITLTDDEYDGEFSVKEYALGDDI